MRESALAADLRAAEHESSGELAPLHVVHLGLVPYARALEL